MSDAENKETAEVRKIAEEKARIYDYARAYAASKGFDINPDAKIVDAVVEGLARNKIKRGARYCPCRPLSGNPDEDKLKICPCKWHKDEIEKDGYCHCVLFFKKKAV
jgi:ferredoxin-thioredoxin reductase catalytic subunit